MEPTHIRELRLHPTLSQNGTVRGSFVGANGRRVSRDTYVELLELFSTKGLDITTVPVPTNNAFAGVDGLKFEKDIQSIRYGI